MLALTRDHCHYCHDPADHSVKLHKGSSNVYLWLAHSLLVTLPISPPSFQPVHCAYLKPIKSGTALQRRDKSCQFAGPCSLLWVLSLLLARAPFRLKGACTGPWWRQGALVWSTRTPHLFRKHWEGGKAYLTEWLLHTCEGREKGIKKNFLSLSIF